MWGGGPPPGGTTESVSEYAPPVSSAVALKVISSLATQSILPSPSATCTALGWFTSMPFLPSTNTYTLFSMLAARHKVVKCGQYAPRIRRPRACVCACHPATMPLAAVRRSAAGLEAGSARRRLVQQEEDTQQRKKKTRRGRAWDWTGFGDKTAWDWMQLLIVPVVLAVGALLFNLSLNARQLETEERRAAAQIEAEDQRAQEERLQTYLEQMGTLLIDEGLLDSEEDDEARYLARARL